ncbi:hypothetical protein ACO0LF_08690 [Undibacterium sp. Di27W]|uniref:hypothetical protein n=1 Tax=Undibacterium sp. Di27W TaxID=3413036 RepID=UPI003BEFFCC1
MKGSATARPMTNTKELHKSRITALGKRTIIFLLWGIQQQGLLMLDSMFKKAERKNGYNKKSFFPFYEADAYLT